MWRAWGILALVVGILLGCSHKQYLRGTFTPQEFISQSNWKNKTAASYKPDPAVLASLRMVDSFEVKAFVGTWCHDSKRELPRLLKLRPLIPIRRLLIIALDTAKQEPSGQASLYHIRATPTFILLRNGNELGRVVERPGGRLEQALYELAK